MAEPPSEGPAQPNEPHESLPNPLPNPQVEGALARSENRRSVDGGTGLRTIKPVDAIFDFGRRELEERLRTSASEEDEGTSTDLAIRLAFMAADVHCDPDECERYLEFAKSHPLAPRFTLSQAIRQGTPDDLRTAEMVVGALVEDAAERMLAYLEIAEAWLYRFANAERASRAAQLGLEVAGPIMTAPAEDLLELLHLSMAVGERWNEYTNTLAQSVATADEVSQSLRLTMFIEAVHAALDWSNRPDTAAKIVRRRFKFLGEIPETAKSRSLYLHAIDIAIATAELLPDKQRVDRRSLLERRLELLEADGVDEAELALARFQLAAELSAADEYERAAEMYALLAGMSDWSTRLAMSEVVRLKCNLEQWDDVATALRTLADAAVGAITHSSYLRRVGEIVEARGTESSSVRIWEEILESAPTDEQAWGRIERRLLRDTSELIADHLRRRAEADTERKGTHLRRAAAVIESREGERALAVELRTESLKQAPTDPRLRFWGLFDIARLHSMMGSTDEITAVYREMIDASKGVVGVEGTRVAGPILCAAAFVSLGSRRYDDAKELLDEAIAANDNDLLAHFGLAELYRREGSWARLLATLSVLADLVETKELKLELLCEIARVAAEELHDGTKAKAALELAISLEPGYPAALRALAELSDRDLDWEMSVELRNRAVDSAEFEGESSSILVEIGNIQEQRKYDDSEALVAYERALAANPKSLEAIRAAARIYRKREMHGKLLDLLERELELVSEPRDVLGTHLDIARTLRQLDSPPEKSLAAYRAALKVDSENAAALDGIEEVGGALDRWDLVAEAFRKAPPTQSNLSVLSDALRHTGLWTEFVSVRRKEAELREEPGERARILVELAKVIEVELHDLETAIATHKEVVALVPKHRAANEALGRLLEASQSWQDLEAEYVRELELLADAESDKRLVLLLRLGDLRHRKLDKIDEAVASYREILKINPLHLSALEALEEIFVAARRHDELVSVVDAKARATEDVRERAALYRRLGELIGEGDPQAAVDAYGQSFRSEPGNRETFTAIEKFCYQHELWSDVMELYNHAITVVEEGTVRAYRLSDLYSRRGQVELQYQSDLRSAAISYMRVVELEADNETAMKFVESIFSQIDDWPSLIDAYERRAELLTDSERRVETLRRASRVALGRLQDTSLAARFYERILEIDASDKEALDGLEQLVLESQDWQKLVEVLKKRLESVPAGDAATKLLRRIAKICEEKLLDEERAITYYQRILEIAPGNRRALEALGRIYESTERWADFVEVTKRQIKVTTDRSHKALLYFKCGSVMEAKFGEEDEAIRYYEAAIKTSPSCMPAVHGLRDLYRRREEWPRVIQTLELEVKLWDDDKERAGVFAQIGRIYGLNLNRRDRAMHYYESALAVDPDCLPANKALFDEYFAAGDWASAEPLAAALSQKAMREGDPWARSEFYRKRGIVCQETGDAPRAADSIIIALEIKPDNLSALEALGRLARESPDAYNFSSTYRELERIYKKRDGSHQLLARVYLGLAGLTEAEGDLEASQALLEKAITCSPEEFFVAAALVDLHEKMRHWDKAIAVIARFLASEPAPRLRAETLLRQAAIHADGEMDPHRAISVLREVVRIAPDSSDGHYRLAQELYVLGRYTEAAQSIDRVIEIATSPGRAMQPQKLSRYYFYLGRILEATGDQRAAASQYRRAADYDPSFAEPALALARKAASQGDLASAQSILISAAHAASVVAGKEAAVPLQRGLARLQLAAGDTAGAIDAYRGILAVQPDDVTDRVALAELYSYENLDRAVRELLRVLDRDIRVGPAYRQLASHYIALGQSDRASRVFTTMNVLGFSEPGDKSAADKARAAAIRAPLTEEITPDIRRDYILNSIGTSAQGRLFEAMATQLLELFQAPALGENLTPAHDDPAFREAVEETKRLFGVQPEIYVGERVPAGAVFMSSPRQIVVIDRELFTESDAGRRFLLGLAFEAIRGGYAFLYSLSRRQLSELHTLLRTLTMEEDRRPGPTQTFISGLSRTALSLVDDLCGTTNLASPVEWVDGVMAGGKRAGLLACDDFAAATRMVARLAGEQVTADEGGSSGLGALLCGEDLVRYYLSDQYYELRSMLAGSRGPLS